MLENETSLKIAKMCAGCAFFQSDGTCKNHPPFGSIFEQTRKVGMGLCNEAHVIGPDGQIYLAINRFDIVSGLWTLAIQK